MPTTKLAAIVMDPNGQPWGPFDDVNAAGEWAAKKWPGKEALDPGTYGWTVLVLQAPQ